MADWSGFPPPAPVGEVPLCLLNGEFCCAHPDRPITTFTNTIKNHPKINVSCDFHHHTRDDGISMYLEVEDNLLKRITNVWYKQGFVEALRVAADPSVNRDWRQLAVTARYALKFTDALARFRYFLQPHLKDNGPKVIAKYSKTRNWSGSTVRAIAWHPQVTKLAVATADDSIRVYSQDAACVSVLKCNSQYNVSSLSWRPFAAAELAVGCEKGVVVWTVDPSSTFTKPSSSHATLLSRSGHSPVTDVCWSPRGDILVSCSAADSSLIVWDVSLEIGTPLKRVTGGGVAFSIFSCDANSILCATTSIVFRVWDSRDTWSHQRWVTRGGRVVAACRSPLDIWLFAVQGESVIYMLNSKVDPLLGNKTNSAVPILDIARSEIFQMIVGGSVLDMRWDPTGRYLAIITHESPAVAVFSTSHQIVRLCVTPCCLITGLDQDVPSCIAFQENFADGACLTIAWSSGRIQYFPIIYSDN